MPAHKKTRSTTRIWKFVLRCPADKMPLAQETIRLSWLGLVKLRKDGDIKDHVEKFEVVFASAPDEGGLAVANGTASLVHRTSVDRVSFPKLRAAVVDALQIGKESVHLEESKAARAVEVKAPAPTPAALPAAAVLEQLNVAIDTPPVAPPAPTPSVAAPPEIGIILPEVPPPAPMPKKVQRAVNKVTRANLAAARPPPIETAQAPQPLPQPSPPLPPPVTPSPQVFAYTYPRAAPTTPPIVFGFRK